MQLELVSNNLAGGGVLNPLVEVADIDGDAFLTNIQNVIQSNQDVSVDDGSVTLNVTRVAVPRGAGYENRHCMLLKTFRDFNVQHLKAKKCLHAVDRRYDPFCGVISLMLGCALVEAKGSMQRKRVFRKFVFRGKIILTRRKECEYAAKLGFYAKEQGCLIALLV